MSKASQDRCYVMRQSDTNISPLALNGVDLRIVREPLALAALENPRYMTRLAPAAPLSPRHSSWLCWEKGEKDFLIESL